MGDVQFCLAVSLAQAASPLDSETAPLCVHMDAQLRQGWDSC